MAKNPDHRTALLREVAFFRDLDPEALEKIAEAARREERARGEAIFLEGDEARDLWVVEDGLIKIYKTNLEGREQIIHMSGPGDVPGCAASLGGFPFPASAAAVRPSVLLRVPRKAVVELVRSRPEAALRMMQGLTQRMQGLVGLIEDLSLHGVVERVAGLLRREAESRGVDWEAGAEIELPYSHEEIASQIGTVREVVTRALLALQESGALEQTGRRRFRVLKRDPNERA